VTTSPSRQTPAAAAGPASAQTLKRLAALLTAYAPHDGRFELPVRGTYAIRLSNTTGEMSRATVQPMLCVVAQGAKTVLLGREVFEYDATRLLTFFVDLPIAGRVTGASRQHPFLCFRLDLDPYRLAELALKVFPDGVPPAPNTRGLLVTASQEGIVEAITRLIPLMADRRDTELLAPLVVDEILIRLLRSPIGSRVAQVGRADSGMQRIAQAVIDIREHFAQPLAVEALARRVHMSVSSFHQHFKSITSMSPLQYQKVLRLQEARRLMLSHMLDARSASSAVGYVSPSQFSREYARLFGSAPTRDIARLREADFTAERA
jgi:AraC-like DNA-binding protein